ncbi:MAG: hypothetical protein GX758_04490 [Tenericutes bacterium]|nr:hypothetical protein [Mycoplasmatota bacterium]
MKKETKRYSLVEYCGTRERVYSSEEEYAELLKIIEKSNRRKTSKYYFRNITRNVNTEGMIVATIHLYNRLTMPLTITELDNMTSQLSEQELFLKYKDKLRTRESHTPDINISYFENKNKDEKDAVHYDRRIKYIPVLYKEDEKYLSEQYIKYCLDFHSKKEDINFFKSLANEFSPYHVVGEQVEEIFNSADKVKYQGRDPFYLYKAAYDLYGALIVERNSNGTLIRDDEGKYQISRRRLRDFGFFVRDYDISLSKIKSPVRYNGQLITKQNSDDKQLKLKI